MKFAPNPKFGRNPAISGEIPARGSHIQPKFAAGSDPSIMTDPKIGVKLPFRPPKKFRSRSIAIRFSTSVFPFECAKPKSGGIRLPAAPNRRSERPIAAKATIPEIRAGLRKKISPPDFGKKVAN